MKTLSVIIPARSEEFLQQTIDDVFKHSELGNEMEVIVGDDGSDKFSIKEEFAGHSLWNINGAKGWPDRFRWHQEKNPIGQRAMQNKLAELAKGKYLMKLDAHVSLSQGFDRVMVEIMEANPNIVLIPAIGNLHVYDWVCDKGHRTYQGANVKKCSQCDSTELKKDLVWKINGNSLYSDFYFDKDLIFQLGDKENPKLLNEVKAIQGSGFMVSGENYWKWQLCNESWGSWGQQGYEVWKKTYDNGGKVFSTRRAFMGHFFRKVDEFPYERDLKSIEAAYQKSKELFAKSI